MAASVLCLFKVSPFDLFHYQFFNNEKEQQILEVLEAVVRRCSVKSCSYKFHKIYRKTPVSTKNRLWHRYFPVKTLFFHNTSRYLSFCLGLLVMYKNGLIRKIWLISKFMTSQLSKLATAIHILPNISRSKSDNEIWSVNRM